MVAGQDYFWKLVTWVEPSALHSEARAFGWHLAQVGVLLWLLLGYSAWLIARKDLSRQQAEEKLAFKAKYNHVLAELSQMLLVADSVPQISDALLAKAMELTGSRFGLIGFVDQQSEKLNVVSLSGEGTEAFRMAGPARHLSKKGEAVFGWMLASKEVLITNDPASQPHFQGSPAGSASITRLLAAPALFEGRLIGHLVLANAEHDYSDQHLEIAQHLASMYALAVKQQWAEDRIAQLAGFDQLTGLVNRHIYNDRLLQAAAMALRNRRKAALLFIDLDHFKLINDTLGHEAGDTVLQEVARRLNTAVRTSDTVARVGGDEFAVILQDLDVHRAAVMVAAKIVGLIATPIPFHEKTCSVGASIGISIFPDDGDNIEIWQSRADEAMYRVKKGRRNDFDFYATG